MGTLIRLLLLVFNLAIAILIKLGFGWLMFYYGVMMIFFSDWMAMSKLNDTISIIGFIIVLGFCVIRKIYCLVRNSRWA